MGASHVSACYAQWSHLPDRPFRLLTYMALIAKDATPEPTFWGGRDAMCLALGLDPDPISYRVARRAVAELVEAGALERKYIGHAGKRSEYRVCVTAKKGDMGVPQSPNDPTDKGGQERPPEGGHLSPQRGTPESAKGDTTVPPRTTRSTRSESEEENSPTKVSTDRAREGTTDEIDLGLTPFEAQQILHDAAQREVDVVALTRAAPDTCTTRHQRRMWAAAQIAGDRAKESA